MTAPLGSTEPHLALRHALLELAQATAKFLRDHFPDGPHMQDAFDVTDTLIRTVEVPDWMSSIYACWEPLHRLPEFETLLEAIKADEPIAKHVQLGYKTPLGGGALDPRSWAFALVGHCMEGTAEPQISTSAFASAYEDLIHFFDSDELPLVGFAPLHGLTLQEPALKVSDNISLVQLTDEERNTHWKQFGQHASAIAGMRLGDERCAARISISVPKLLDQTADASFKSHPYSEVDSQLSVLVSALRLHKPGNVGRTVLDLRTLRWCPFIGWQRTLRLPEDTVGFDGMNVSTADLPKLSQIYSQLSSLATRGDTRLGIAVSRHNQSLIRPLLQDRLVDAIVGLEAIYLADDQSELSYRLSLRAASATATDSAQRVRTFQLLRAGYALRSRILHGKPPEETIRVGDEALKPSELLRELVNVLRLSLLDALANPSLRVSQWLAEIDRRVLIGPTQ